MKKICFLALLMLLFASTIYAENTTSQNITQDTNNMEQDPNYSKQEDSKEEETIDINEQNQDTNTATEDQTNQPQESNTPSKNNETSQTTLASNAKSAIMIEASTGKVIYEKNANEKLPMASMTKMMTLLLIMENIESGNLKWNEKVKTSEYASSMGGSQIFLEPGEEMTVEDLVKGICIGSGNDASVAMAERIGGTEEEFVKMMNKKAKELNLKNTHFVNACGLDADDHYSSAQDMATIAKELISHEKILKFTGTYEEYLRKDSAEPFWLVNTNKLVRYYSGVDGLKTGYTKTAGYCITTTAKKNNLRLITVVMGEPTSQVRNSETTAMLDYGFNTYEISTILSKEKVLSKETVKLGKDKTIAVVPKEDINVLNTKTGTKRNITYQTEINTIKAPVKKGDKVGKINVIENNKVIMTTDLTVTKNVTKANIIETYFRELLNIINGSV